MSWGRQGGGEWKERKKTQTGLGLATLGIRLPRWGREGSHPVVDGAFVAGDAHKNFSAGGLLIAKGTSPADFRLLKLSDEELGTSTVAVCFFWGARGRQRLKFQFDIHAHHTRGHVATTSRVSIPHPPTTPPTFPIAGLESFFRHTEQTPAEPNYSNKTEASKNPHTPLILSVTILRPPSDLNYPCSSQQVRSTIL